MPKKIKPDSLKYNLLAAKTNGHCWYCGVKLKLDAAGFLKSRTIDHVIPRSKGGTDIFSNLVPACTKCNQDKADLSLKQYRKVKSQRLTYRRANDRKVIFYGETLNLDDAVNDAYLWIYELQRAANTYMGLGSLKLKKFRKMIGMEEDVPNNN